jgi:hypothetical protein
VRASPVTLGHLSNPAAAQAPSAGGEHRRPLICLALDSCRSARLHLPRSGFHTLSGSRRKVVFRLAQVPPRKVGRPILQRSGGAGALTTAEVVAQRRAALRLVKLEPGIGYWLAKQRWLWRYNR